MNVEIRAARVDDHRDIYELLSCPGVVRDTDSCPTCLWTDVDSTWKTRSRGVISLSLRLRAG